MTIRRRFLFALIPVLAALLITCAAMPSYAQDAIAAVQVVDEEGQPLLARITVAREDTPTPDLHVFFTDETGACLLDGVPAGPATVQAVRGPEWTIESRRVTIEPGADGVLTLALRRLHDLKAEGYYQGDAHMHSTESDGAQPPEEVAFNARCEGLDWAILTDHETVSGHAAFKARAVPGFLPLGGQEITTREGHILGLGISSVVSRDVSRGAEDMRRIFREVREQGGVSVLAHPMTPTMNYQHWDVDDYDVVEILNGSLPPYLGLFDMLQARLRWHRLLNEGRRVAAIGTSDNHCNLNTLPREALRDPETAMRREPRLRMLWNMPNREEILLPWAIKGLHLGTYRTCLRLPELTEPAVLDAIRAGRGFITNGPIIIAQVNETDPGSDITGPTAQVRFEVVSNVGLQRLDVVAGGEVVKSVEFAGEERASGGFTVELGEAQWLVLECYGTWPEFATTNAWYVAGEG